MDKYFIFRTNGPFDKNRFESLLKERNVKFSSLTYHDDYNFELVSDGDSYIAIDALLGEFGADAHLSITSLCSIKHGEFEDKLIRGSIGYFSNRVLFPSDIIMKQMTFGNYSSFQDLKAMFKGVSNEIMMTVGAYLRCGLNGLLAAKSLFIHRNTFNYRLDTFIRITGLDIRDYHNALLLELYFQFGNTNIRFH